MPLFTICLPVRNAQASLETLVDDTLEAVHDVVPRFEIVVFDNGSTDATPEVAHELSMRYPQVRRLAFPLPVSREMWWRAALQETRGDTLLVRDPDCRIDIHEIHKLWQEFAGRDAVLASSHPQKVSGWVGLIERLGQAKRGPGMKERTDLALIRRRAFDAVRGSLVASVPLADELRRYGHPFVEVTLKSRNLGEIPAAPRLDFPSQQPGQGNAESAASASRVRRPNYLNSLKNFALGE